MICKNCKTEIPDHLSTCPKCGSNTGVNPQLFCTKCGTALSADKDFCTSCGSYTEKKKTEMEVKESSVSAWATLSFIIPIFGFILAALESKRDPKGAKIILVASLIGMVIELSVFLPSMIYYLL